MINILFAGDFCPLDRVAGLIEQGEYKIIFDQVKEEIEKVDYAIVNLEAPIVNGQVTPIEKCGPNLCCTENAIDALQYAGFDCVTLANNHFRDYGEEGALFTISKLLTHGVDYVGAGRNLNEAAQTFYKEINGKRFAFINCCEHEYSIATNKKAGSNPLNPIQQYYAITEAKNKADYVLVIVHGGIELYQLPTPRMVKTYHFFIDSGADAIINHHQHCISGSELYKGKPIIYGLGNFCFDRANRRNSIWNEGYMVKFSFKDGNINFMRIPYTQCNDAATIIPLRTEEEMKFNQTINRLESIIIDPKSLANEYESFLINSDRNFKNIISPYSNRYLSALYVRGFLPGFMSRKKWLSLQGSLICESHYERFIHMINGKLQA